MGEAPVWDSSRLISAAASVLYAVALGIVAYGGARFVSLSSAFPLSTVVVQGELQRVTRADIVGALQDRIKGTFFSVELDAGRALVEGVPWVRRAEVRRRWPDRLEVRIEEHVALARWQGGEPRLVNTHGEPFSGRSEASLPLFSGPAGSEGDVVRRYLAFCDLLSPLSLEPRQVSLSSRLAWQLKLSNGLTVQLGRDSDKERVEERLAKFVSVYPQTLGKPGRRLEYVDLRYPNGFALQVPEGPRSVPKKPGRKRV
jgi:cell division protein FtsQ